MAPKKLAQLFYILICLFPIVIGLGCRCSNGICQRCFPCSPIGIPTNGPRTNVTNVINANITVEPVKLTPIAIPQIEKENSSSIWFDSINDFANGHTGLLMAICICQILILIMQCRNQKRKLNERNEGQLTNKFAEKPGGAITPISPEELQMI